MIYSPFADLRAPGGFYGITAKERKETRKLSHLDLIVCFGFAIEKGNFCLFTFHLHKLNPVLHNLLQSRLLLSFTGVEISVFYFFL